MREIFFHYARHQAFALDADLQKTKFLSLACERNFFHYARHQTLALDTIARLAEKTKPITRVRENFSTMLDARLLRCIQTCRKNYQTILCARDFFPLC